MGKKRHTPEDIVSKLRQVDVLVAQGTPVADAIRALGVTEVDHHRELAAALQPCIGTPIWLCHWREEVLLIGIRSRGVFGVPPGPLRDGLSAG